MPPSSLDRRSAASIVSALLGVEIDASRNLQRAEIAAWDSLKHVELVFALEDEYQVRIPEHLFAQLDSLDAIVAVVERLRAA